MHVLYRRAMCCYTVETLPAGAIRRIWKRLSSGWNGFLIHARCTSFDCILTYRLMNLLSIIAGNHDVSNSLEIIVLDVLN